MRRGLEIIRFSFNSLLMNKKRIISKVDHAIPYISNMSMYNAKQHKGTFKLQ